MANYIINSVVIVWGGETHSIKVTNELCNHLESRDINLYKMYVDSLRGELPKMFLISNLIVNILATIGVIVDQSDIKKEMTYDPDSSVKLRDFSNKFLSAAFPIPEDDDVKKPLPPVKEEKASKKK